MKKASSDRGKLVLREFYLKEYQSWFFTSLSPCKKKKENTILLIKNKTARQSAEPHCTTLYYYMAVLYGEWGVYQKWYRPAQTVLHVCVFWPAAHQRAQSDLIGAPQSSLGYAAWLELNFLPKINISQNKNNPNFLCGVTSKLGLF